MKGLQQQVLQSAIAEMIDAKIEVIIHQAIGSTNDWSLQQCRNGRALPFACFAENQTSGRGRRGKQWLMSAGANIAMSITWPFNLSAHGLNNLPISIALAVVKTLEAINLAHVQIKWPNDIYVQGKKIAGILIETQPLKGSLSAGEDAEVRHSADNLVAVVIGIGLNYDMSLFDPASLNDDCRLLPDLTDISSEISGQGVTLEASREYVAAMLLREVINTCRDFQRNSERNLEVFRERYDYCKDKTVIVVLDEQQACTGLAQGVNGNAELVVKVDGKDRVFNSAEVSVKTDNG